MKKIISLFLIVIALSITSCGFFIMPVPLAKNSPDAMIETMTNNEVIESYSGSDDVKWGIYKDFGDAYNYIVVGYAYLDELENIQIQLYYKVNTQDKTVELIDIHKVDKTTQEYVLIDPFVFYLTFGLTEAMKQ
jgi:hypothetical protein